MTHKLLIVDDHPETLDIIARVLRQQGYVVTATSSGIQGIALAESERPDLILLDGMMPDLDGWEVCRRIRNNPKISHTAIIMFSAVSVAEQKLAGFDAGADDYLTKPTEPVELIERVRALLEDVPPRPDLPVEDTPRPIPTSMAAAAEPGGHTMTLPTSDEVIMVLGTRGGTGTTLLALNLAVSLAEPDRKVTLVDLDVAQGHVGLYLNQKVTNGLNKLARLPEGMVGQEVLAKLTPYNDSLQLLLTDNNLFDTIEIPSPQQMLEIMAVLTRPSRTLVIDGGRGVTAVTRPVIEAADHIIVCAQPERVGLAAAKQFLTHLQDLLFPHTKLWVVLLEFSGGIAVPQQAIEGFLGHPIAAIIPITPQELRRAVNKNIPLVQLFPEAKATMIIGQLAHQLVKE